jgi:hypothetical protein
VETREVYKESITSFQDGFRRQKSCPKEEREGE